MVFTSAACPHTQEKHLTQMAEPIPTGFNCSCGYGFTLHLAWSGTTGYCHVEQALCNLIGVSKFQMAEVDGFNPPPPSTLPDPIFLNKWQSEWKIGTAYKANVEMEYPRVHVMHCAHPSYCAYV